MKYFRIKIFSCCSRDVPPAGRGCCAGPVPQPDHQGGGGQPGRPPGGPPGLHLQPDEATAWPCTQVRLLHSHWSRAVQILFSYWLIRPPMIVALCDPWTQSGSVLIQKTGQSLPAETWWQSVHHPAERRSQSDYRKPQPLILILSMRYCALIGSQSLIGLPSVSNL